MHGLANRKLKKSRPLLTVVIRTLARGYRDVTSS